MKVIVCGSRKLPQMHAWKVGNVLWHLFGINDTLGSDSFTVAHGGCPMPSDEDFVSVDQMAHQWVNSARIALESGTIIYEMIYLADWTRHAKAAGPVRNQQMANDGADLCVAFAYEPEGISSRGTRNMIIEAQTYGIPVWSVTIS